ncbi:hypothetical protein INT43_005920 [Umbelopsis isabellina]|uniref:FAM192A/Fyv6 N-terminal domain-containing protein n=1 Tax=Mortierella isabellina TaxID=91625 RepID=A0A8H7PJ09_MORIS|nr:hypothetical protein INT43_005920 [Umbelopsis isabellina]
MSFNISSSFVSREVIDEDGNSKQLEWDKVRSDAEKADAAPSVPTEPYDPRTLYERLQEQKTMKEDALKEAMRFSNLVKRIDDDEMDYYRTLTDTQIQAELAKKRQEAEQLDEYRRAVDQASSAPEPPSLTSTRKNESKEDIKKFNKLPAKRSKSTKDLLQGVVVAKKRNADENGHDAEDKPAKRPDVRGKQEKEGVTKNENTSQLKQDNSLAAKSNRPISSLVSYGDDSSSDED